MPLIKVFGKHKTWFFSSYCISVIRLLGSCEAVPGLNLVLDPHAGLSLLSVENPVISKNKEVTFMKNKLKAGRLALFPLSILVYISYIIKACVARVAKVLWELCSEQAEYLLEIKLGLLHSLRTVSKF